MAYMPGYLAQVSVQRDSRALTITYRFRAWHPSILPVIWGMVAVEPRILKPVMVLWAWVYLMRHGEGKV